MPTSTPRHTTPLYRNISAMRRKVTIYGERCSGTNYLEELLTTNFDVEIVWDYGWKHFFGFQDLRDADDVLFIGIVRNVHDWINSMFREKHHLPAALTATVETFLSQPFYSIYDNNREIMEDRHLVTGERYRNIFEMRLVKTKFLRDTMPMLVKHYHFITYDDLVEHLEEVLTRLKDAGLSVRPHVSFPANVSYYRKSKTQRFVKKTNQIPSAFIDEKLADHRELIMLEATIFPEYAAGQANGNK